MRLRKPGSDHSEGRRTTAFGGQSNAAARAVTEVVAIGREMLRIPAGLYMRAAEEAGAATLVAWRFVRPMLESLWWQLLRLFYLAEREVTPLRAALAVAAVASVALAAAQFADYRSISIGVADYVGVDEVAPAPEVEGETKSAGSAHAWVGLPLALAALVAVFLAARGNRRAAWWLAPIGLAVIAVSLIVDVPKGLDEGDAAVAYQGAEATLLGGFWVQIMAGAALVLLAPLIGRLMAPGADSGAAGSWRSRLPRPRMRAGEAGT